jgi:hypothetical protein
MKKKLLYLALIVFPIISNAAGVPTSFTYQGKALNAAGTAPLTSTVSFTLSITDPSSACILYQESQTNVNLATTNGIFALQVGSLVGATKRVAGVDPGLSMTTLFANAGTQLVPSNGSCPGYTPLANDVRKLHVVITPSSGSAITVSPDLTINAVPNSMVAETLQGQTPNQLAPPGFVMPFAGTTCPSGFVATDGSSYATTGKFANLFATLQYTYGGSGVNFSVPNTQGIFLRGAGTQTASGVAYTAGSLGTIQSDQMQGHIHSTNSVSNIDYYVGSGGQVGYANGSSGNFASAITVGSPQNDGTNGNPRTGTENRPVNMAINYCIKY